MDDVAELTVRPDRRELICRAALELVAAGGNRAVTHTAIDRALDLPAGSSSYYFRTRHALLAAAIDHLTTTSRTRFETLLADDGSKRAPADVVAAYLSTLLTERRVDVRARFALAFDASADPPLAEALANCLFSRGAARSLFASVRESDPDESAADLLTWCEGVVASSGVFDAATPAPGELAAALRRRFPALT